MNKKTIILIILLVILFVLSILFYNLFIKKDKTIENGELAENGESVEDSESIENGEPVEDAYWPTSGWKRTEPENLNIDKNLKENIDKEIKDKDITVYSYMVIKNGYVVAEELPKDKNQKIDVFSVTKSIVSTLVGIAIDKGYIDNENQKVLDFFPDYEIDNLNSYKKSITISDLLKMRAGILGHSIQAGGNKTYTQSILDQEINSPPDTQFNYSSLSYDLLTSILQIKTNNVSDFAYENLFKPLGISDYLWLETSENIPFGGYGLQMKTEDLAKIGYLYLNDGKWQDKQIISKSWIEKSTTKYSLNETAFESWKIYYGMGWWIHEFGPYAAHGYGGQFIYVIPELDMVVVMTGSVSDEDLEKPQLIIRDTIMTSGQK